MTAPVNRAYAQSDDVGWDAWTPHERATLLFVFAADQVLLIRKKRGLGAGKINGPGGRLEPGETPLAAAVREVEEEVGVVPTDVRACGELAFQFVDGYALLVHVFAAAGCVGEPCETDEAIPLWTPVTMMPYEAMWADDQIWFPHLLAGTPFRGRFLFDGHSLLGYDLTLYGAVAPHGSERPSSADTEATAPGRE
jgi:8-oxo-dGTP diphosphatase